MCTEINVLNGLPKINNNILCFSYLVNYSLKLKIIFLTNNADYQTVMATLH